MTYECCFGYVYCYSRHIHTVNAYANIYAMSSEWRPHRLRLKLPGGAELEAEGTPEFVWKEREEFLRGLRGPEPGLQAPGDPAAPAVAWDAVTEAKGRGIQLRGKLPPDKGEKDACLVLLAASEKRLQEPRPTATQLAKWLRTSGYPILRMDRALQDAVSRGEILASGSRRSRRYELTASGRLKAYILASQLTARIGAQ